MEDKGNGSDSENVTLSTCGFLPACTIIIRRLYE